MKRLAALLLAAMIALSSSACRNQTGQQTTASAQTQEQQPEAQKPATESEEPAEEAEQPEQPEQAEQAEQAEQSDTQQAEQPEQAQTQQAENILIAYFSLGQNADYPEDVDATASASLVPGQDERVGTTEWIARLIQQNVGGQLHAIRTAQPYPTDFDAVVDQNHAEMEAGTLPELVQSDLDVSEYDTVFVGYPVWATNAPQAIFSFLSQYDLAGKTVIPFCTHDGYGAGSSYSDIAQFIEGEAAVLDGLAVEAPDVPDAADTVAQWLQGIGFTSQEAQLTPLTITVGDAVLDGVLYDTALAQEIQSYFPLTVSMVGFGGREYYGGVDFYPTNLEGGQTTFENGEIAYCEPHHNMAIFYAQTDDPILSVEVIPIGRVTSDLSVFEQLPGNVEVTFALAE